MPSDVPAPPPGTRYLTVDLAAITELWERFSAIRGMFDDDRKDRPDIFVTNLKRRDSLWLERTDGNGILYLLDIKENLSATAHFVYWDRKLSGREDFTMGCLKWAVERLNLEKVTLYLPHFATAAIRFATRLGFRKEGQIRRWARADGELYDIVVLGMVQEEVFSYVPSTDAK